MNHKFPAEAHVRIVKDLTGEAPEVIGREAEVKEQLESSKKHPQYKVLIFGGNGVTGGIFEADERELESRK